MEGEAVVYTAVHHASGYRSYGNREVGAVKRIKCHKDEGVEQHAHTEIDP